MGVCIQGLTVVAIDRLGRTSASWLMCGNSNLLDVSSKMTSQAVFRLNPQLARVASYLGRTNGSLVSEYTYETVTAYIAIYMITTP